MVLAKCKGSSATKGNASMSDRDGGRAKKIVVVRHDDSSLALGVGELIRVIGTEQTGFDRCRDVDTSLTQCFRDGRIHVLIEVVTNLSHARQASACSAISPARSRRPSRPPPSCDRVLRDDHSST